jgi:hypothetical protein
MRQLASRAITRSRDVIVLLVEFHDRIDTPSPLRSAIGHAILAAAGAASAIPDVDPIRPNADPEESRRPQKCP